MSTSGVVRVYFLFTIALLVSLIPIMSGAAGLDTSAYQGLLQRVFTLTIFSPIGVSAFLLAESSRGKS